MNLDRRLLRLLQAGRTAFHAAVGLGLAGGVLTVAQAWLLATTLNQVFILGHTRTQVAGPLYALLAVILLRALVAAGAETSAVQVGARVKAALRRRLVDHLRDLGPARVRGEQTGELVNLVVEGVEALDPYFSQYLPQVLVAALVPLSVVLFIFPLDLLSGVVLLVTAPLVPLFMALVGSMAKARTQAQWQQLGPLSAFLLDALQGLPTLKALGQARRYGDAVEQTGERYRVATMEVLKVSFLSALVLELVTTLSTAVVAVEIGLRLLYGWLPFPEAFVILLLAPEFYLPLRTLGARFHAGMTGVAAAQRIFAVLETPTDPGAAGGRIPLLPLGDIQFHSVTVQYSGRDAPALQDVSLRLRPGQHVALVGPTGSGKSTLVHALLGLVRPQSGQVRVGDVPLDTLDLPAWRTCVAWVPQQPFLFHDTVEANLRLARPTASTEEIIRAAQAANAHGFIQALPQGYATVVGERGARLSGGQAQRLALARAFLRDAPLLVLDEATSCLDAQTEAAVLEATRRLMAGRTVLTVAHRLSTVQGADTVVVLEAGRVVEQGTHAELLLRHGAYHRLVHGESNQVSTPQSPPAAAPVEGVAPGGNTVASTGPPLWRLVKLARPFASPMALAVLLGVLTVGASLGLMTTATFVIAAAALHPSIATLQVAIVGVRFFGILRGGMRYLERLVSHGVTLRLLSRLRATFYRAMEPLAPAGLTALRSGDLLGRAVSDVGALEGFYVRVLAPPLVAAVVVLVVGVAVAGTSLLLALVLVGCLVVAGALVPVLCARWGARPSRDAAETRQQLSVQLVDLVQGLPDLVSLCQDRARAEEIHRVSSALSHHHVRLGRVTGLQAALSLVLNLLAVWLVLFLAIPWVGQGITGVGLAVLVVTALSAFEAVQSLPAAAQHLAAQGQAARRLFEFTDAPPPVPEPTVPAPVPASKDLALRGLGFRYPDGTEALHGVDLDLPVGKRVALVGSSGAGKSTLVNILLRFWEAQEGQLTVGGTDLRRLRLEDARALFTVVNQGTYVFSTTVRENLRLANPAASDEHLQRALAQVQLLDHVNRLPQGLATWVGEHGLQWSGGERQRLGVARALLRDAPVLLLDEPVAHLDPVTARRVLDALLAHATGRALLLITHVLLGMEQMDEILVLEAGRVEERGTHAELLGRGGRYRRLWDLQHGLMGPASP